MPKLPLEYKKIKDERKLSILDASASIFIWRSVKSVTIDDIAKAAKCSHGLIYHYFRNVEDVYNTLMNADTIITIKTSLFASTNKTNSYNQLERITQYFLIWISEKTFAYEHLYLVVNEDFFLNEIAKLIHNGQKDGEVTGGLAKDIALAYQSLLKGILLTYISDKKVRDKLPSFDIIMNVFRKRNYK